MKELFPDTDNFFKYLLTIGLILIVFVIIYPVQEQKEVDIEINNYMRDTAILHHRISRLTNDIAEFVPVKSSTQSILDSLKKLEPGLKPEDKDKLEALRAKIKDDFDTKKQHYQQLSDSLYELNITTDAEAQKVRKLEGYFSFFKTYKIIFLIVGIGVALIGLFYWTTSVYRDEKKKDEEIATGHESAFVRHCKSVKEKLKNRWVLTALILVIIGIAIFIVWISSYS